MKQLLVLAFVAACATPVGVTSTTLPHDSAQQCAGYCQTIGLSLESVVIMANNVGCVCDARPATPAMPAIPATPATPAAPATSSAGSTASAGGMAAIMMRDAEQQQETHHQH